MSEISAKTVKELRDRTGVGMAKCKEALVLANGDIEEAISILRKAGMAQAVKKEGRETKEGVIKSAQNTHSIALVEVNAETDFVVKSSKFQEFADELAEEICKTRPLSVEEFLVQKYSGDQKITIDEFRAIMVQSLGEHLKISRLELFPIKENFSIGVYSHAGGKLVTLVEIEGDGSQQELAREIAMHIAAESPEYLTPEEVPQRVKDHEKEIARAQVANKPAQVIDKILEGKLKAYFQQVCLLLQPYVKDSSITVDQFVKNRSKEIGKNLKITQFLRWNVGS